jgi:hypothetical protein
MKSQFSFCPKRKTAFDQLHRSLQRFPRTNQQMEMVWHYDKVMQQVLSSPPIVQQDFDKEPSHSLGLKDIALLKCGASDEVATVSGIATLGSGHGGHLSGLIRPSFLPLYRSAQGAAPPKGKKISPMSQFET